MDRTWTDPETGQRWRRSATGRWRIVESASHHRERRQRRADRLLVQLAAAAARLARHHGSEVPVLLRPLLMDRSVAGADGSDDQCNVQGGFPASPYETMQAVPTSMTVSNTLAEKIDVPNLAGSVDVTLGNRAPCCFFATPSGCWFGNTCQFLHGCLLPTEGLPLQQPSSLQHDMVSIPDDDDPVNGDPCFITGNNMARSLEGTAKAVMTTADTQVELAEVPNKGTDGNDSEYSTFEWDTGDASGIGVVRRKGGKEEVLAVDNPIVVEVERRCWEGSFTTVAAIICELMGSECSRCARQDG